MLAFLPGICLKQYFPRPSIVHLTKVLFMLTFSISSRSLTPGKQDAAYVCKTNLLWITKKSPCRNIWEISRIWRGSYALGGVGPGPPGCRFWQTSTCPPLPMPSNNHFKLNLVNLAFNLTLCCYNPNEVNLFMPVRGSRLEWWLGKLGTLVVRLALEHVMPKMTVLWTTW